MKSEADMRQEIVRKFNNTKDPVERLRLSCLSKGFTSIRSLSRVFRHVDVDGNKKIDFYEMLRAVKEFGVNIDTDDCKKIFMGMDRDRSGLIDIDEFLVSLRPPMTEGRLQLINLAFDKLDTNRSGEITVEDIRSVYNVTLHPEVRSGRKHPDEVLRTFLMNFEKSMQPDGKVTWPEFVDYYAAISAAIDDDSYFQQMMTTSWRLNENPQAQ